MTTALVSEPDPAVPAPARLDLATDDQVRNFLARLFAQTRQSNGTGTAETLAAALAAAILPWACDRLPSKYSREAYARDIRTFVMQMAAQDIGLFDVTGDELREAALVQAGKSEASISRTLSTLRGIYEQLGKKGLVPWERVRDIQAVGAPRVEKNTTPALSEPEATRLLHTPNRATLRGTRDCALLFVFFKTAARVSAIASAKVGHIERTDTEYYLRMREKGGKKPLKALLEAAPALLEYVIAAGIREDLDGPLFRPLAKDRKSLVRAHVSRQTTWSIVKGYARAAGIAADRIDSGRGVGVHSLRKTAITNALDHGAPLIKVKELAGHSDIRTTSSTTSPRLRTPKRRRGIFRYDNRGNTRAFALYRSQTVCKA